MEKMQDFHPRPASAAGTSSFGSPAGGLDRRVFRGFLAGGLTGEGSAGFCNPMR